MQPLASFELLPGTHGNSRARQLWPETLGQAMSGSHKSREVAVYLWTPRDWDMSSHRDSEFARDAEGVPHVHACVSV